MTDLPACPRCGAALAPRQEYCLDCGARATRRRRRLHWIWPVAATAILAAGGAYGAIELSDTDGQATIVALGPLKPVPPPGGARQATTKTVALRRWPARNGFTIVLAAIPAATGRDAAEARARQAAAAGLPDVGTLDSARYASLHPGYSIVFSGVYRSRDEALIALPRAASRFRTAYAQEIVR